MAEQKTKKSKVDPDVFVRRTLIGRKIGMTQIFADDGTVAPVTVVEAGPCIVVQVKSSEGKDGYDAAQIGFEEKKKNVKKPQLGHFEKAGVVPKKRLSEVKLKSRDHGLVPGTELTVDIFEGVKKIDVRGTSKGKGFAGTIKRWHFTRGPASHGSMNVRQPGSIGCSADPSRVFKGTHMPGHMGRNGRTCRNLKLVKIDKKKNLLFIGGSVPGPKGGFVEIMASREKAKKTRPGNS